jgi:hypothetical protein
LNAARFGHRIGVTSLEPFQLVLELEDTRYRSMPLCHFLPEHEGAKLANHPQAFRDIHSVARKRRATHQLFDRRVDIEAMAEKGPEMLGQLDGSWCC